MRNLYLRLGVSPAASGDEIRSAIASCPNASIRADATEVLLIPDRRRAYDRLHGVLSDIGRLRAALGLSHGDNWRGDVATDYTQAPAPPRSRYAEFKEKIESHVARQAQRREQQSRQTRRGVGAGVGGVGAAAANFAKSVWELFVGLAKAAALLAVGVAGLWFVGTLLEENRGSDITARPAPAAVPAQPAFTAPPVAMPPSGSVRKFLPADSVAPFAIETSGGGAYLVKLEDAFRGTDVLDIFVRGGDTVEVKVPLGTYVVKYASGATWYGYEYRFGPETQYDKAETTFDFRDEGYQITGYTITLYQVRDGNMQTRRLSPAEF